MIIRRAPKWASCIQSIIIDRHRQLMTFSRRCSFLPCGKLVATPAGALCLNKTTLNASSCLLPPSRRSSTSCAKVPTRSVGR